MCVYMYVFLESRLHQQRVIQNPARERERHDLLKIQQKRERAMSYSKSSKRERAMSYSKSSKRQRAMSYSKSSKRERDELLKIQQEELERRRRARELR